MEKWKSVAIMALLGMMIGYGAFQQKKAMAPPPADPAANSSKPPPPAHALKNTPATNWAIPAANWTNTKKPLTLSDLKGSVALIEFFRIGCPHCEKAAPIVSEMHKTFAPRGLKIVAFHSPASAPPPGMQVPPEVAEMSRREHSWPEVKSTIEKWGMKYPVAFDESSTVFKSSYKGTTFPTFFLLDKNAKIVEVFFGDKKLPQLRAAIEAQLAKK